MARVRFKGLSITQNVTIILPQCDEKSPISAQKTNVKVM